MMKQFTSSALAALLVCTLASIGGVEAQNATAASACAAVDANTDQFPTKVEATASLNWNISYFNTYKVVTNIAANETYLLYLCGSTPPADVATYKEVIEIPVQGVGVDVTPTIPFLEQLGLVENIVAFTTLTSYISSPCLLESIEQGNVLVLLSEDDLLGTDTEATQATNETLAKLERAVAFTSHFNMGEPLFETSVKVSEYTELTNGAIFEWIKFYSAFFNLEAEANEIFALTQERWQCVSEEANRVTADLPAKPVVLWAYYSDYCGGWDAGTCPNYYCEYASECSAELLGSDAGNYSEVCMANFLSTEQIVELGLAADHWIYPSANWNETYTLFKDQLDTMKAVQDKQVFDYQASGPNAWFEQRYPEYFAVLQDFCSIVGTTQPLATGKSWFRNVMDGSEVGSVGTTCTEDSRSNSIVPVAGAVCADLQSSTDTNGNAPTPSTTADAAPTASGSGGDAPAPSSSGAGESPVSLGLYGIAAMLAWLLLVV